MFRRGSADLGVLEAAGEGPIRGLAGVQLAPSGILLPSFAGVSEPQVTAVHPGEKITSRFDRSAEGARGTVAMRSTEDAGPS
jgi:hypothetical protein